MGPTIVVSLRSPYTRVDLGPYRSKLSMAL